MTESKMKLRLIYPASPGTRSLSESDIISVGGTQLQFVYKARPCNSEWNHLAGSLQQRLEELLDALFDPNCDAVICGRGGYGCSDLLSHIPWHELSHQQPKPIIGFSDISALHAAFLSKLNWHGIHGPMPDTAFWQASDQSDVLNLNHWLTQKDWLTPLDVSYASSQESMQGWLFGGCLSVLSNLIGTEYLPRKLNHAILFFEDVGESPGRILRNLNQWIQSGLCQNIEGFLLGQFADCGLSRDDHHRLAHELATRSGKPVAISQGFGHCHPNHPLPIGQSVTIKNQSLQKNKGVHHVS